MNKSTLIFILIFSLPIYFFGQNAALYDVTFTSIWNATDHTSVPISAHWSKLVGATHKTANAFLQIGSLSTTGIKNVAELGNNTVFNTEVSFEITNGEADQYIDGPNLATATGDMLIPNLTVHKNYPLLTLVSMIAPSPDWMISLNSYSLLDGGGNWKTSAIIDVFAYDAGTDSGIDYTSPDSITNPFQAVTMISGLPFNGNKMGTITITLKTILGENAYAEIDNFNIYPNPTINGKITINDIKGSSLKKIEIYNISGTLIKSINQSSSQNTMIIDTHHLVKGLYFLKLTDDKNISTVRKFEVN